MSKWITMIINIVAHYVTEMDDSTRYMMEK